MKGTKVSSDYCKDCTDRPNCDFKFLGVSQCVFRKLPEPEKPEEKEDATTTISEE